MINPVPPTALGKLLGGRIGIKEELTYIRKRG
jgi:hypothetical protein